MVPVSSIDETFVTELPRAKETFGESIVATTPLVASAPPEFEPTADGCEPLVPCNVDIALVLASAELRDDSGDARRDGVVLEARHIAERSAVADVAE
ncbi:hypothetical protein C5C11_12775 [Rathayibacter rathayi]|nr:hypothetical protein C5C11_12775 [Rathayibacter rathayi]